MVFLSLTFESNLPACASKDLYSSSSSCVPHLSKGAAKNEQKMKAPRGYFKMREQDVQKTKLICRFLDSLLHYSILKRNMGAVCHQSYNLE